MNWLQPINLEIFKAKYMINGEETPEQVLTEVAEAIAANEGSLDTTNGANWQARFQEIMDHGLFLPAGRILANARKHRKTVRNLNNCFTIELEDSMEGIFGALREDAVISKNGGGVGFDASVLRPKGSPISKGGTSSGVISFLRIFNESAKSIHTGGSRRSAHIALLDISHPDIEEFITIKQGDENKELTQFNISVKITDAFMKAVADDAEWNLVHSGKVYKTVMARQLFKLLIDNAFYANEPGIFFVDTVNRYNNAPWAYQINSCNPCGEQPLGAYQACCLGAINLAKFVAMPEFGKDFSTDNFRMASLKTIIRESVRFLDDVVDITDYPLPKNKQMAKQFRRIGLGFTGFGDALALLGLRYDSEAAQDFTRFLATEFRNTAYQESVDLAKEKGAFKDLYTTDSDGNDVLDAAKIDALLATPFIQTLPKRIRDGIKEHGLRNVAILTVAPTGTTALSLGQNCSSGIEPIFSLEFERTIRMSAQTDDTRTEIVYDYGWLQYLMWVRERALAEGKSPAEAQEQAKASPPEAFKATAGAIAPEAHIVMQSIWQQYIDSSISKTINLPEEGFTADDYAKLLWLAYSSQLKGFTTFNPRGKLKGILVSKSEKKAEPQSPAIKRHDAPRRPQELPCDIHVMAYQGNRYVVLIGMYQGEVYEGFVTMMTDELSGQLDSFKTGYIVKHSKGQYSLAVEVDGERRQVIKSLGKTFNSTFETVARLISMGVRHGVPLKFVVEQLTKGRDIQGFERVLARILKKYIKDGEVASAQCDQCGVTLEYREGCMICPACGWSKCG